MSYSVETHIFTLVSGPTDSAVPTHLSTLSPERSVPAVVDPQGQQGLLCWPKHNQEYIFFNIFPPHKYVLNYSP